MLNRLKSLISPPEQTVSGGDSNNPNQNLPAYPDPAKESITHKEQGDAHLRNGDLEGAKTCYQHAITFNPNYAKALSNLGFVLKEQCAYEDAEHYLKTALSIDPNIADAHYMLGTIFQIQDRLEDTIYHFRKVLELDPDFEFAYRDLCYVLFQHERIDDAKAVIAKGIAHNPNIADYHYYLGNLYTHTKELDKAVISYRNALSIQPAYAEVHSNLGIVLQEQGNLREAIACYQKAIAFKPAFAEAHCNMGAMYFKEQGLLSQAEAEAGFRRALGINPNYAEAHYYLGNILLEMYRLDEAEASYRRTLEINPNYAEAHYYLGNLLLGLNRLDEAEASYRRTLQIDPDHPHTLSNLGAAIMVLGRLDEAEANFRRALEIKPDFSDAHSNLIFTLDMMDSKDTASLQEERKRWDAAHAAHLLQRRAHSNIPDPARRLRVGYVSADLIQGHSAPKVFGGMLTQYDRSQFDVFAYSNFKGNKKHAALFKQSVTVWRDIGNLPDDEVAEMIRVDQIDILVDLSGYSAGNRLLVFARKPAPIQITAWGYATSTGMRAMDVFFADPVVVPPEDKQYFTEEIRYLPSLVGAFFNEPFPDVNELPALSGGIVTFGSLNRLAKLSDLALHAWADLLLRVPRSRLILKTGELNDDSTRERVIGHFIKSGVAADRIIFQGRTTWYEHMQAYNQIDFALDPFPHGGGVTALEGLMMGVPAIVLRWPTVTGRTSASIMTALGLADWIAETQEKYVELAIQKASDLQSLAALRQQLRRVFTSSVMGDPAAYARAVEQEYRKLWQEWCAGS
ncbi:MAG: hypothetical protein A2V79_06210, partial [Betaproteobacteria bacterium RBG_16_56_24]